MKFLIKSIMVLILTAMTIAIPNPLTGTAAILTFIGLISAS